MLKKIIRFTITGGLLFLLDWGILFICTDVIGIYYLWSSFISFAISNILNYIISSKWVFESKGSRGDFTKFIGLSIIGVIINQIVMYILVSLGGIHYLLSKIVATAVVMVYNFISRIVLFKND